MVLMIDGAMRVYLVAVTRADRSVPTWRAWCDSNRNTLTAIHGRAGFLRVKFEPEASVPPWLDALGIACDGRARGQLAKAGRGTGWDPAPDLFGVRALYAAGLAEEADAKLRAAVLAAHAGLGRDAGTGLEDMAADAEALGADGFVDEARGLAEALAALPCDDDLVAPTVAHARDLLFSYRRR